VVKYLADRHFKARQGRRETVMRERCSGSIIMVAIAGTAAVISVSTDVGSGATEFHRRTSSGYGAENALG
jgi:hypothetical protein